jgi:hypothetical protein
MKHILMLLLLTTAAWGQSMQDQQVCHEQARKYIVTAHHISEEQRDWLSRKTSIESRVIGSHCYVRFLVFDGNNNLSMDTVEDVFTDTNIALWEPKTATSDQTCLIGKQQCHVDHPKFNNLLYAKFPAFKAQ